MIYEFIYSINILVSVLGFLSCFYILIDNTLNKQTARCVIPTCLAGFVWFILFYSSLLNIYKADIVEVMCKLGLFYTTISWINKEYIKGISDGLRGIIR